MLLKRDFFDPTLPWPALSVAEEYSRRLARLGGLLFIGCGSLFFLPLTQMMALALACVLVALGYYLGREYRVHVAEILKQTSTFKIVKIFAPTWRYLLMTTFLMGVGIDLTEWSFFAEQKKIIIGLIVATSIPELLNSSIRSW